MGPCHAPRGYRRSIPLLLALTLLAFGCSREASNDHGVVSPALQPTLESPLIAFASNRGGMIGIHLYDPATGEITRLSPAASYDATPAIAPDGTRIAFAHLDADGRFNIMTMAVNGSDRRTCTDDSTASDTGPRWSPDSGHLVFTRTDRATGHQDIWAVDRDGTLAARITMDGASRVLDWSPDGRRLLIVRRSVSGSTVFEDAQTFDMYSRAAASLFGPAVRSYVGGEFSPDGNRIMLSVALGLPAAYLLATDSTVSFVRWMLQDADFSSLGRPSWSPDGKDIAFSGDDDLFAVAWRLENLTSLLADPPVDQDPDWGPKP